jgi:hypothetical protein
MEVFKTVRFLYPNVLLEIGQNDLETALIKLFLSN